MEYFFVYDIHQNKYSLVEKNVFAAYHLLRFMYIRSNKQEKELEKKTMNCCGFKV